MKGLKMRKFDSWLKWISTSFLILGSILASINLYPLNILASFIGNAGWFWAGIRMREPSLWVVSGFLLIVYLGGLFYSGSLV
jgi:sterol desaturase/sphingolipid hydroxylase (fatty acid hydroxylase superfamily)